jgi:hypothetical protein
VSSPRARARMIAVTLEILADLPLRTRELMEFDWRKRAERDIGAALSLAIPFIDRARRMPSFCEMLTINPSRHRTAGDLAAVANGFLAWDHALCRGLSSDWSRRPREDW